MTYSIVYDAVKKKATSRHHNVLIGNVELAASIGLIYKELNYKPNIDAIRTPDDILTEFNSFVSTIDKDSLSEISKQLLHLIEIYQIKAMVNETLENLTDLICCKEML